MVESYHYIKLYVQGDAEKFKEVTKKWMVFYRVGEEIVKWNKNWVFSSQFRYPHM